MKPSLPLKIAKEVATIQGLRFGTRHDKNTSLVDESARGINSLFVSKLASWYLSRWIVVISSLCLSVLFAEAVWWLENF